MIGIDPDVIRRAASRFASVTPARKPQPVQPRNPNSLKARVIRLAETVETFTVADIVVATNATQKQAWSCVCKLAANDEVEVVVRGGGRIPGTSRGGKTAMYRRVKQ